MAKKRKGISASVRWSVFARDGFTCRYCGARGGQDGVELQVDHLMSLADGGDDSIPNLLTACQRCNGGKGAKTLQNMPDAEGVADRMRERAASIRAQADALHQAMQAEKELLQEAVNLKCDAYNVEEITFAKNEKRIILNLCGEFGTEAVIGWYRAAYARNVPEARAVKYVCGCARNMRDQIRGGSDA